MWTCLKRYDFVWLCAYNMDVISHFIFSKPFLCPGCSFIQNATIFMNKYARRTEYHKQEIDQRHREHDKGWLWVKSDSAASTLEINCLFVRIIGTAKNIIISYAGKQLLWLFNLEIKFFIYRICFVHLAYFLLLSPVMFGLGTNTATAKNNKAVGSAASQDTHLART